MRSAFGFKSEVEEPQRGPHGAKAYSRACLCRSRRAAWPGALMDQNCKQMPCGKRGYLPGDDAADDLPRRRRRTIQIDPTRDAEYAVIIADGPLWRRARQRRAGAAVTAQREFGQRRIAGRTDRSLSGVPGDDQALEDQRIGECAN